MTDAVPAAATATTSGSAAHLETSRGAAIGMMVTAMMLFTLMDSIGKWLSGFQPVQQVVWGRYFFQFVWMLFLLPAYGLGGMTRTSCLHLHIGRGLLVALATICLFSAVSMIPLADAYSITFAAPLIVTILSIPLLGERVGWRRWSAILLGFAGVLVVIRPGFNTFHWALLLPLVTASCFALYQLLTRKAGAIPGERPMPMLFYMALVGTIAMSCLVPAYWQSVQIEAWVGMAVMGALAAIGHMMLIQALAKASAVTLSPFIYTQLIWAILLGYVLFDDWPDFWMLLGGAIIVGSGLFVFFREAVHRKAPTAGD
ncbi:MAG: DMT family transporter [Geminicoccaceae bacterium]